MIRALVKLPLFLILSLAYISVSLAGEFFIRNKTKKLHFLSSVTSLACGIALSIFGIRIKFINKGIVRNSRKYFAVSNHLSYLDILMLSSAFPSLFITSVEVQKTFFLGFMSSLGGSFFVERRSKTRLREEIERIAGTLMDGFTVTLFPEGTSSNGETVLPFKGALFSAAQKSEVDVLPVCIRYDSINGLPVSPANRDLVFYYGDISFFPHFLKLFTVKRIDVTITFLDPVKSGGERKVLVDNCYAAIKECLKG